ncbi:unnamed protein product [Cyclocybe aegerita]|uniref:HNH nuclease domain-containing protein n=1 Tax=Cyclocybe aegerita TaxID=1973307 RepID=A0A8S0VYH1_CYCAE|nr:unnamed protein product [Cyclocybe aegerita]
MLEGNFKVRMTSDFNTSGWWPIRSQDPSETQATKQTPNARSTGDSIDPNQKESADDKFLKASSLLKLPKGTKACVVTLRSEPGAGTEMCHIVARKKNTGPFKLSYFEFLWGIEYKEFCVDTSRNLMRLSANLHRAFDEDSWALLPIDDKVLSSMRLHYEEWKILGPEMSQKQYEHHIFKKSTIYGKRKAFRYVLLPLASPRFHMPVLRCRPPLVVPQTAADMHIFPYNTLPELILHVEPHYVIWNLGEKFKRQGLTSKYIAEDPALTPLRPYANALRVCLEIFEMWYGFKTPEWFYDNDDDDDDDSDDSDGDNNNNNNELDPNAGSPSRGTRAQKRKRPTRTDGPGGDGSRGYTLSQHPEDELMDDIGSDDSSSRQDDDKDDFMESEEDFSNRIDGWRGEVAIFNESSGLEGSGLDMVVIPPCGNDFAASKLNDFESHGAQGAAEVI